MASKTKDERKIWKSQRVELNICHIHQVLMTTLDAIECTMDAICYETQILS